jgi:ADP-ribose pyrophosphatase
MKNNWKIFNKKILHNGFYKYKEISFKYKRYNGKWSSLLTHELFGGAHVASVLPYDPVKKKNYIN